MPSILDRYDYLVETGEDDYTRTPTGSPVVSRLIQGKSDVFLSSTGQKLKHKALLIDKDEFINDLPGNITQKINTIRTLLNASPPYEIYAWNENQFIKLSAHNLHLLDVENLDTEHAPRKTRTSPDTIKEQFVLAKEVNVDSIATVDKHDLKEIAANRELPFVAYLDDWPSPLDCIEYYNQSDHAIERLGIRSIPDSYKIIRQLMRHYEKKLGIKKTPTFDTGILNTSYSLLKTYTSPAPYSPPFKEKVKQLYTLIDHSKIDIKNLQIILTDAKHLHTLILTSKVLHEQKDTLSLDTVDSLPSLTHIQLGTNSVSPKDINTVLSKAPATQSVEISLDGVTDPTESWGQCIRGISLEHLSRLSLHCDSFKKLDGILLFGLPKVFPRLQDLSLDLESLPKLNSSLKIWKLDKLGRIQLNLKNVLEEGFHSFLHNIPNLVTLKLDIGNFLPAKTELDYSTIKLNNLKHLSLQEGYPNYKKPHAVRLKHLIGLLNRAKELETLTLTGIPFENPDLNNLNALEHLKILHIKDFKVTRGALEKCLTLSPNIEKLILSDNSDLNDFMAKRISSLSKLSELELSSSPFNSAQLIMLLDKSPHLKKLTFNNQAFTFTGYKGADVQLNDLAHLSISNSTLNAKLIFQLIKRTNNLEHLTLTDCQGLGTDEFEPSHLAALKTLTIDKTPVTENQLSSLLGNTESLTHLSLTKIQLLNDIHFIHPLPNLTHCALSETLISTDNIEKLLNNAANLESLILEKCDSVFSQDKERHLDLPASFPYLKELDITGNHVLTTKQLIQIIDSAPNIETIRMDTDTLTELKESGLFQRQDDLRQKCFAHGERKASLRDELEKQSDISSDTEQETPSSSTETDPSTDQRSDISEDHSNRPGSESENENENTEEDDDEAAFQAAEHIYTDPTFDPNEFRQPDPEKAFKFDPTLKKENQGRIINLLSQYLTVTHQHEDIIPDIQKGVCLALSNLFYDMTPENWQQLKSDIFSWDGKEINLKTQQHGAFQTLLRYVNQFQLSQPTFKEKTYAGDALIAHLTQHPGHYLLSNEWHQICVKYHSTPPTWTIYDPNYVNGEREVNLSELALELKHSIGPVVSLIGQHDINPSETIENADLFLENGGFFTLSTQEGNPLLDLIDSQRHYSDAALDGLLLVSTSDIPAWYYLMENPATAMLAIDCLNQFILRHPNDYQKRLDKSIESLPEDSQSWAKKCFDLLDRPSPSKKKKEQRAMQTLFRQDDEDKEALSSPAALTHSLLNKSEKRQLIEFEGYGALHASALQILEAAKTSHTPVFVVNSPDDLSCAGPWIEKTTDGIGKIHNTQGGPLYDFMKGPFEEGVTPIILLNYANFKPKDIVRFNTIIDSDRLVDGVPVPENIKIIGLSDTTSPHAYKGSDFYSRFDRHINNPFKEKEWQLSSTHPPSINEVDKTESLNHTDSGPFIINFYHGQDWQDTLLGRWELDAGVLHFKEGKLIEALKSNKPLLIQNGPWQDKGFELFWETLQIKQGYQEHITQPLIKLSQSLIKTEGYVWESLAEKHTAAYIPAQAFYDDKDSLMLNPHTINQFIQNYHCDNQKKVLHKQAGFILQHAERYKMLETRPPLSLQVTNTLSDNDWAKLLEAANTHEVSLQLNVLPGVFLPKELASLLTLNQSPSNPPLDLPTAITVSNDIDATVDIILRDESDYTVIDATEYGPSDLLQLTDAAFHKDSQTFEFQQSDRAVLTLLKAGKKVLLKGPLSDELNNAILPYLKMYPERLKIVTDNTVTPPSIPYISHTVSLQDKKDLLGEHVTSITDSDITKTPYINLKAIIAHQHSHQGEEDLNAPWDGQDSLDIHFELGQFTADTAEKASQDFMAARHALINQAFQTSPIVCLSGITGVGKSTFIDKELKKSYRIHHGSNSDNLKSWQKEGGVLFIDEANITARGWSEFEGLFNTPQSIIIDGELHPLDKDQKVIFAFNPSSYSSDRETNRLFRRHGNTIIFDPLSLNVIYHDILSPLFNHTPLQDTKAELAKPLLDAYALLTQGSADRVLVSARELKSIVMMAISHQAQGHLPKEQLPALIKHYTKTILGPMVPDNQRVAFNSLLEDKPAIFPLSPPSKCTEAIAPNSPLANYLLTPSREPTLNRLNAFLALRAHRQHPPEPLNESQQTGGLGGIVIEGEPGLGKSVLAEKALMDWGLHKALTDEPRPRDNVYYNIPASLSNAKKRALLIQAFEEGAPVIMDEMNSASLLERTLNDLLMGKHPDDPTKPVTPGFMIIATQNPITMKGRVAQSQALNRRMTKVTLPHYTPHEMNQILERQGMKTEDALSLIDVYQQERMKAKRLDKSPPNFRTLLKVATKYLEQQGIIDAEKQEFLRSLLEQEGQQADDHLQEGQPDDQDPMHEIQQQDPSLADELLISKEQNRPIFDKALSLFKTRNNIKLVASFLELSKFPAENPSPSDTFYEMIVEHLNDPSFITFMEKFDFKKYQHDINVKRAVHCLSLPEKGLNEGKRNDVISAAFKGWSHKPINPDIPSIIIRLAQYSHQRKVEQGVNKDAHKSVFAKFFKGDSADAETKIQAATKLLHHIKDGENSKHVFSDNQLLALQDGRLKKIVDDHHIELDSLQRVGQSSLKK